MFSSWSSCGDTYLLPELLIAFADLYENTNNYHQIHKILKQQKVTQMLT